MFISFWFDVCLIVRLSMCLLVWILLSLIFNYFVSLNSLRFVMDSIALFLFFLFFFYPFCVDAWECHIIFSKKRKQQNQFVFSSKNKIYISHFFVEEGPRRLSKFRHFDNVRILLKTFYFFHFEIWTMLYSWIWKCQCHPKYHLCVFSWCSRNFSWCKQMSWRQKIICFTSPACIVF